MSTALRVVHGLLFASLLLVARAARITKVDIGDSQAFALEGIEHGSDERLQCGLKSPTYKDYYFDIPVFGDKLKFLAVQLVRDPNDPKLIVYEDAVWMHEKGTDKYIPVPKGEAKKVEPMLYRLLDDMVYLKKEDRHLEFVHRKCTDLPERPGRDPEQKRNSLRKRASSRRSRGGGGGNDKQMGKLLAKMIDKIENIEQKQEVGGSKRRSFGPGSKRRSLRVSGGSSRRNKQSIALSLRRGGGSLRNRGIRGGKNSLRNRGSVGSPSLREAFGGSLLEAFAHRRSHFEVNATDRTAHHSTLDPFTSPSPALECTISMEVNQALTVVEPDNKQAYGAGFAGATIGYMGPLWLAAENGVMIFPALGVIGGAAGGYALAKMLMTKGSKVRLLGADKLFEKLYCMSKANTCGGHPCFKECKDEKQNLILVPFGVEPEGMIRC